MIDQSISGVVKTRLVTGRCRCLHTAWVFDRCQYQQESVTCLVPTKRLIQFQKRPLCWKFLVLFLWELRMVEICMSANGAPTNPSTWKHGVEKWRGANPILWGYNNPYLQHLEFHRDEGSSEVFGSKHWFTIKTQKDFTPKSYYLCCLQYVFLSIHSFPLHPSPTLQSTPDLTCKFHQGQGQTNPLLLQCGTDGTRFSGLF